MKNDSRAVRGLGEIALRVSDIETMQRFYQEVIGLKLMRRFEDSAFFRIASGYGGHTQILALFDRSARPGYQGLEPKKSTIDHVAFEIALEDLEAEKQRLEHLGLRVTSAEYAWVHWRSIYVNDPEGNRVELTCYDETVV